MHILAPIISGKELADEYVEAITKGADKVTLLQIVDREFMKNTSAAMGEVMQFSTIMSEVKKKVSAKRKPCQEITEWGATIKKILAITFIQKADKVVFVEQDNEFFREIIRELEKEMVNVETVHVISEEEKKEEDRANKPKRRFI